MSERRWQDCYLSDLVETQLRLFFHLSAALDESGVLPRRQSAEALRRTAAQDDLRPGVRACLRDVAELLERAPSRRPAPAWRPRLVPNDVEASGAAGPGAEDRDGATRSNGKANGAANGGANGRAYGGKGAGQGRNGRDGPPSAPWPPWPRPVEDDDPESA